MNTFKYTNMYTHTSICVNLLLAGTFFGYSALNIMNNLLKNSYTNTYLTCIEGNDENASVARFILDKGLGQNSVARMHVRVVDGISSSVLVNKREELMVNNKFKNTDGKNSNKNNGDSSISSSNDIRDVNNDSINDSNNDNSDRNNSDNNKFDFIFLDHDKNYYLKDLKLLENLFYLSTNYVVVADNVIFPGAPGYLEYVGYSEGMSIGSGTGVEGVSMGSISMGGIESSGKSSSIENKENDNKKSKYKDEKKNDENNFKKNDRKIDKSDKPKKNKDISLSENNIHLRYSTRLVSTPFERIGYETQWKEVEDAMSVTVLKSG